jgi:hypothetical protein
MSSSEELTMKLALMTLGAALAIGALPAAHADQEVFDLTNWLYREERGSCHVAYPPPLLPKASWQAIMAGLDKHFGTNATVDAKAASEIQVYLEANVDASARAASRRCASPTRAGSAKSTTTCGRASGAAPR